MLRKTGHDVFYVFAQARGGQTEGGVPEIVPGLG